MGIRFNLNKKKKENPIRKFAIQIVEELKEKPLYIYTSEEIEQSKFPKEKCQLCQQYGCDLKNAGQYVHKKCLKYVKKKTLNFAQQDLKLKLKK